MKSELIERNYDFIEKDVFEEVVNKIYLLMKDKDIKLIKCFQNDDDVVFVLLNEDNDLFMLEDGVDEEVDGLNLSIENVKIRDIEMDDMIYILSSFEELQCEVIED